MALFVPAETGTSASSDYFSTKRINVPILYPRNINESTFCTCIKQCVPALPVFTDQLGGDFYKNDYFSMYMNLIPSGSVVFKIVSSDGTETTVTDDTYGRLDTEDDVYYFYRVDWYKVWDNLGYDTYYLSLENKLGSGVVIQKEVSPKFKLQRYSDRIAHGTVRIESLQSGILLSNTKYLGANNGKTPQFEQMIRFRGSLSYSGNIIQNDDLQLNNTSRSLMQIKDQSFPEYKLTIALVSGLQIARTLFDYLFANNVNVSDYNVYNHIINPGDLQATAYRSIPLKRTSDEFTTSKRSVRKTYTVTMEYANKNIIKVNN